MKNHLLDQLMLWLLAFYQKFVSPYKGFQCAYGVWIGQSTCSAEAKKILKQDGLIAGWPKIQAQLQECRAAYLAIQGVASGSQQDQALLDRINRRRKKKKKRQDGAEDCVGNTCDLSCDVCDCSL